jgi:hypothetical protein
MTVKMKRVAAAAKEYFDFESKLPVMGSSTLWGIL